MRRLQGITLREPTAYRVASRHTRTPPHLVLNWMCNRRTAAGLAGIPSSASVPRRIPRERGWGQEGPVSCRAPAPCPWAPAASGAQLHGTAHEGPGGGRTHAHGGQHVVHRTGTRRRRAPGQSACALARRRQMQGPGHADIAPNHGLAVWLQAAPRVPSHMRTHESSLLAASVHGDQELRHVSRAAHRELTERPHRQRDSAEHSSSLPCCLRLWPPAIARMVALPGDSGAHDACPRAEVATAPIRGGRGGRTTNHWSNNNKNLSPGAAHAGISAHM
jgi:hypothetical protein